MLLSQADYNHLMENVCRIERKSGHRKEEQAFSPSVLITQYGQWVGCVRSNTRGVYSDINAFSAELHKQFLKETFCSIQETCLTLQTKSVFSCRLNLLEGSAENKGVIVEGEVTPRGLLG